MAKKGKLSLTEKYAIQGMLHKNMTVENIASSLDRTESSVQKYIDNELETVVETVAKSKVEQAENKKVKKEKRVTAKDLMVTKTAGQEKSVAIMTQGASEKGDAFRDKKGRANRVFGDNIYRFSDGKQIKYGDKIVEEKDGPRTQKETNQVKNMLQKGKNVQQIASALHRDIQTVQEWIYELGD